jgi:hypothetical protein
MEDLAKNRHPRAVGEHRRNRDDRHHRFRPDHRHQDERHQRARAVAGDTAEHGGRRRDGDHEQNFEDRDV